MGSHFHFNGIVFFPEKGWVGLAEIPISLPDPGKIPQTSAAQKKENPSQALVDSGAFGIFQGFVGAIVELWIDNILCVL